MRKNPSDMMMTILKDQFPGEPEWKLETIADHMLKDSKEDFTDLLVSSASRDDNRQP